MKLTLPGSLKLILTQLKSYKVLRILYYFLKHKVLETQIFIGTYRMQHSTSFTKPMYAHEHAMGLGPQNDRA